jgi:tetratricopeptide (TPR) repeat protein
MTRSTTLLSGAKALWLSLALALPAAAQDERADDRVALADGTVLEGEIKSEDYDGLQIDGSAGKKRVPWDTVVSVHYGDAELLANAVDAYAGNRIEEALQQLDQLAAGEAEPRPVIQQQALYYRGLCQQRQGDFDAAMATFRELVKEFPRGRYLRRAAEELVECAVAKGDLAGAGAEVEQVLAAAKDQEAFVKESGLLRAKLAELGKDYAAARSLYQEVAQASGVSPSAVEQAKLGVARTHLLEGSAEEAAKLFRALTAESRTNLGLAGAWNGLGDVWREGGRKQRNQESLMDAIFAYLRGAVLYPPKPGEPTAEHEHAMGGVALVYKYLSELEQNPEKKRLQKERYDERRQMLAREYPNSPWLENLN